ncbi:MAG TPA: hypothetical protein VI341_07775 [Actinomycetota bacterium]
MRTPTSAPGTGERAPAASPARQRRQQDLIVLPEARPSRRWAWIAAIAAGVLVALVVGGAIGYAVADGRADDRAAEAAAAARLDAEAAALEPLGAAQQQVAAMELQVIRLEDKVERQRQGNQVILATRRETRAQLDEARADLAAANADLRALQGPTVSDGTHIVKVVAAGPSQSPQRIVVQAGRWFTGPQARRAAIEDGVIVTGQRLPHRRYFRPSDGVWSTVDVSPTATVTVRRWAGSLGTRTVSFAEFERILRGDAPWARRAAHDPYWITVAGGDVTSMQQQRYP